MYLQTYWDGYDSNVNPGVIDAFASAAFRFGHSLLPTAVERWSKAHKFIGNSHALLHLHANRSLARATLSAPDEFSNCDDALYNFSGFFFYSQSFHGFMNRRTNSSACSLLQHRSVYLISLGGRSTCTEQVFSTSTSWA